VDASRCDVACSGDPTTICGGVSLLVYYAWEGPALYNLSSPTNNDAGEYSLLIGGVYIPLMASQIVTGKVTFVESSEQGNRTRLELMSWIYHRLILSLSRGGLCM
jgi:hypothetical protein